MSSVENLDLVKVEEISDSAGIEDTLNNLKKLESALLAVAFNRKKELDKIENKFGFDATENELKNLYKENESRLMQYVGNNIDDVMKGRKSIDFANGRITARESSEVYIEDESKSIELLEEMFPSRVSICVNVTQSLSKSTLKNWKASELAQIGVLIQENINLDYCLGSR